MRDTTPSLLLQESMPVLIAFAIFGAAFFYYVRVPINHDTGWFMYAARGMLAGGKLYRDYIDVNAPMAYLTLIPAAWLSGLPYFSNEAALTINILAYVCIAYFLCMAVMRHMNLPPRSCLAVQGALLIIMCFMPHYAFGQREHIFAVLLMPYALAAGMRSENRALPPWLAIACGISAGIAASVKPQFMIVPVFIEAAILLRRRSWKIEFTYDVLAFALSTVIIYLFCYLRYPVYWKEILPSAVDLYGPYDNFGFVCDVLFLQVPLFAIGLLAGEYRGHGTLIGARWTLAAATLGAFALFIAQRKGWPHHALPILMFMSVLFVVNLADIRKLADRTEAILRAGVTAIAIACAFVLSITGGNVDPDMMSGVESYIRQTGGSFFIMSTGNYPAFPLALNRAYTWTSRYPQLLMLPGLIEADVNGKPSPREPAFRAAVLEDLERGHPAAVFLYTPVDAGGITGDQMLEWFRRDLDFDLEWRAHYRPIGTTGPFAVFKREEQP